MTPNDIAQVQASFAMLGPIADQLGPILCNRLLKLDPELKPRLGDLRSQSRQLMSMISGVVKALSRPDALIPALRDLLARNDIQPAHHAVFLEALLGSLQAGLGTAFSPDVKAAWERCYAGLAERVRAEAGQG